jgi:hypothetical protein
MRTGCFREVKLILFLSLILLLVHPVFPSPTRPDYQSPGQQRYYLNPAHELRLLKKLLVFERNWKSSPGEVLVVGILYQKSSQISSWALEDWLNLQQSLSPEEFSVEKARLVIQPVDLDSAQPLEKNLSELNIRLLYLTPLELARKPDPLPAIIKTCEKLGIGTLTAVPEYLEAGVAFGFVWQKDRYQIVINLEASRAQGLNFSSQFLRLTTVRKTNG